MIIHKSYDTIEEPFSRWAWIGAFLSALVVVIIFLMGTFSVGMFMFSILLASILGLFAGPATHSSFVTAWTNHKVNSVKNGYRILLPGKEHMLESLFSDGEHLTVLWGDIYARHYFRCASPEDEILLEVTNIVARG